MGNPQTKANNKYKSKTYDRIELNVPKGRKKVMQTYAESANQSLNAFVITAVDERIERMEKDLETQHE